MKRGHTLNSEIEKMLNHQVEREAYASFLYYAMASWCESVGYHGTATFFYAQGDEEMEHMKKVFHYINDANGYANVPPIKRPPQKFDSFKAAFEESLKNEQDVTSAIHEIVDVCLKKKDYTTFNFLQWYVDEQLEEENLFRTILDKIDLYGIEQKGLYLLDKELAEMTGSGK